MIPQLNTSTKTKAVSEIISRVVAFLGQLPVQIITTRSLLQEYRCPVKGLTF